MKTFILFLNLINIVSTIFSLLKKGFHNNVALIRFKLIIDSKSRRRIIASVMKSSRITALTTPSPIHPNSRLESIIQVVSQPDNFRVYSGFAISTEFFAIRLTNRLKIVSEAKTNGWIMTSVTTSSCSTVSPTICSSAGCGICNGILFPACIF